MTDSIILILNTALGAVTLGFITITLGEVRHIKSNMSRRRVITKRRKAKVAEGFGPLP